MTSENKPEKLYLEKMNAYIIKWYGQCSMLVIGKDIESVTMALDDRVKKGLDSIEKISHNVNIIVKNTNKTNDIVLQVKDNTFILDC